jgi:hypothetical protein
VTVSYQPARTVVTVEDHVGRPQAGVGPAAATGSPAGSGLAAGTGSPAGSGAAAGSRPALLAEAGGGHGLAAMRERTQRAGGTARAGPTADGWLVELEVPA